MPDNTSANGLQTLRVNFQKGSMIRSSFALCRAAKARGTRSPNATSAKVAAMAIARTVALRACAKPEGAQTIPAQSVTMAMTIACRTIRMVAGRSDSSFSLAKPPLRLLPSSCNNAVSDAVINADSPSSSKAAIPRM